jgi:Skp family chaperone for outer membrane proteins
MQVARSIWGAALVGVLALTSVAAQTDTIPPVISVLTIDQESLFADTLFGKAALDRRKTDEAALTAENLKIETALEAEERELTTRRETITGDEFRALAEAFDTKVEGIRTAQRAKATAISQTHEEERRRFFIDMAAPVIAEIMQSSGAIAVLDKRTVVLSLQSIDITDTVVREIDAKFGDGALTPQPSAPAQP